MKPSNSSIGRHELAFHEQVAGIRGVLLPPLDQESPGSSPGGATDIRMRSPVFRGLVLAAKPLGSSPGGAIGRCYAATVVFRGLVLRRPAARFGSSPGGAIRPQRARPFFIGLGLRLEPRRGNRSAGRPTGLPAHSHMNDGLPRGVSSEEFPETCQFLAYL